MLPNDEFEIVVGPGGQKLQTIDPRLIEAQAEGIHAGRQLKDLQGSPAMAQALRMRDAPAPGVTGQGYSAAGPTLMQGLAHMFSTRHGANKVREMEQQAAALRGNMAEGDVAALQAQQQQNQINQQHQMAMAQLASQERQKMMELKAEQVRANYETWVNPATGEMINASRSAEGVVDEQGNPTSIEGMVKFRDSQLGRRFGNEFKALGTAQRKDVIGADLGIRRLNEIADLANSMDANDLKYLNRPGLDIAVQAVTPKDFEAYLNTNHKNLPRKVKQYLMRVHDFSSNIRHQRFGSALTANETALANAFLPSATGLGIQDRTDRLNAFYDDFSNQVAAIDNITGTTFTDRLTEYRPFTVPEDMTQGAAAPKGGYLSNPEFRSNWEQLEADNAEYKKVTGEDLPEYTQWKSKLESELTPKDRRTRQRGRGRGQ